MQREANTFIFYFSFAWLIKVLAQQSAIYFALDFHLILLLSLKLCVCVIRWLGLFISCFAERLQKQAR